MDLSALTIGQLKDLQLQVAIELSVAEKKIRDTAMEQIYQIASSLNMPLNMLIAEGKPPKAPQKPGTQYQDPADPNQKWTGRGPHPKWIKTYLAAGKELRELAAA